MKTRLGQYPLSEMIPGDRFYIARDRHKTVLQLSDLIPFETKMQIGFAIKYANTRNANDLSKIPFTVKHKASTRAIFLRNVDDK